MLVCLLSVYLTNKRTDIVTLLRLIVTSCICFFILFSLSLLYYAAKQLNQSKGLFSHAPLPLENRSIAIGEYSDYVPKQQYVYLRVTPLRLYLFELVVVLVQVTHAYICTINATIFLLGQSYIPKAILSPC